MKIRMLKIDDAVRVAIAAQLDQARRAPISRDVVEAIGTQKPNTMLADRVPGLVRPQSIHLEIADGYRCSLSFEDQPVGLCIHLSISVNEAGHLPNPNAVRALAVMYGLPEQWLASWTEEFAPNRHAINIVALAETIN